LPVVILPDIDNEKKVTSYVYAGWAFLLYPESHFKEVRKAAMSFILRLQCNSEMTLLKHWHEK
jgi:hypothetical protein